MTLEQATVLFLVIVFAIAEIYRCRRAMRGTILALNEPGALVALLPVVNVEVRLENGQKVTAGLSSCVLCLGRLNVGDQVRVRSTREGWVVDLPWLRHNRCSSSAIASKSHLAAIPGGENQ